MLSADASVAITIDQRTIGRRKGSTCVKATRKLARAKTCVRYVREGIGRTAVIKAGPVKLPFSGRLGARALVPATYRASFVATANRKSSRPSTVSFTVVRR